MATIRCCKDRLLAISARASLFVLRLGVDEPWRASIEKRINLSELVHSAEDEKSKDEKTKENEILNACFSNDGSLFALITSCKQALVLDVKKHWSLLANIGITKTATCVAFDGEGKLVVADRSGSVRRYDLRSGSGEKEAEENIKIVEDGDKQQGEELFGHLSQVLDLCFSPDGRLILTADRDEKLRITRYPQTHIIESFCLGHFAYVKSIVCVDERTVATGGGDGEIRLWDLLTGACIFTEQSFDDPIRKLEFCPKEKVLIVLPEETDASDRIRHLVFDSEKRSLHEEEKERQLVVQDDLLDVVVSQESSDVFVLGRKAVYIGSRSPAVISGFDATALVAELSTCEDRIPYTQLLKHTGFNNHDVYLATKAERIERKKGLKRRYSGEG